MESPARANPYLGGRGALPHPTWAARRIHVASLCNSAFFSKWIFGVPWRRHFSEKYDVSNYSLAHSCASPDERSVVSRLRAFCRPSISLRAICCPSRSFMPSVAHQDHCVPSVAHQDHCAPSVAHQYHFMPLSPIKIIACLLLPIKITVYLLLPIKIIACILLSINITLLLVLLWIRVFRVKQ